MMVIVSIHKDGKNYITASQKDGGQIIVDGTESMAKYEDAVYKLACEAAELIKEG